VVVRSRNDKKTPPVVGGVLWSASCLVLSVFSSEEDVLLLIFGQTDGVSVFVNDLVDFKPVIDHDREVLIETVNGVRGGVIHGFLGV
jgi:hypothetical protein